MTTNTTGGVSIINQKDINKITFASVHSVLFRMVRLSDIGEAIALIVATWLGTAHSGLTTVSILMIGLGFVLLTSALLAKETQYTDLDRC